MPFELNWNRSKEEAETVAKNKPKAEKSDPKIYKQK